MRKTICPARFSGEKSAFFRLLICIFPFSDANYTLFTIVESFTDRQEQMRKRTFGRIISLIFWAAFSAGLVCLALSSFALKNFWLPWTAQAFGYALTVDSASFSPLRQGPNLTLRGLTLQDPDGNEANFDFCEARLKSLSLLAGIVDADAVRLNGVRLQLSREAKFTGFDTSLKSRNLKIGAVDLSDIRIAVPLPDGSVCEAWSSSASISGLIPETDNTLTGTFRVYPAGMAPDAPGIDLRAEMRFSLDRQFRPVSLLGSLAASNGSGLWHDRALSGTDGLLLLQAEKRPADNMLHWKADLDVSGIDCTDLIHAEGKGCLDYEGTSGSMNWAVSVRFSDARFQERYLPDRISPENLRLKEGVFSLEWDPQTVHWTSDGEIALDKLWIRETESVSDGSFRVRQDISYSRETKELSVQELKGDLQMGDASVSCRNEGVFIFSRDEAGYHVRANNSSLLLNVRALPADLLNPFLPVSISGGRFSLDYRITADSGKQELTGGLTCLLKGASLSGENREEIVREHDMKAKITFHSRGLENIRGVIVDECSAEVTGEQPDRKIMCVDLSGSWNPRDGGLTLSGRMDLNPYDVIGRFVNPPAEDLREILRRHDAENVWYHCSLNTDFDPVRSSDLFFGIRTSFDTLAFLESGIKTPLELNIEGKVSRERASSGVDLHTIRLDAGDLASVSARGHLSLSDGQSNFDVEVERISPVIPRGLMRFFFRDTLTEAQISLFRFKSLSGEASFRFDPADQSLRVFPFRAVMIPTEDDARSAVTLTLDKDYLCFLSEPEKSEAAMSLVVENLPVKWFDFLLPDDTPFQFLSGMVQGSAEVTVRNNGADIFLDHDAIAEDFSFAVKEAVWETGDCRATGKTCFRDIFTSYDLGKVQFRCMDGTQEYHLLTADGSVALTPEGLTWLNFEVLKTSELLPVKLFGDLSSHLAVRSFDAAGKARFDGNEDYSRNKFTCGIDIRLLEWEPDEKDGTAFEPLEGKARIDLATEPDLLRFHDSGVRLADRNGHLIFHLAADGDFSSDMAETGPVRCSIRSDGVDGESLYRIFSRKTGPRPRRSPERRVVRPPQRPVSPVQPRKAPEVSADPVQTDEEPEEPAVAAAPPVLPRGDEDSAVWPFRGEPPTFRIYGYKTELVTDLRNLTLTDHVKASLSGKFSASDETLEAKDVLLRINESAARCSGRVRTAGKNGFEYNGRLSLSELDMSGLIQAAAQLKGETLAISDLRGVIRDLNLEVRGRGLSLRSLDRYLKVKLNAEVENLSIPYDAGTAVVMLRLLLLPIQQIPKLVKLLPPSPLRRTLLRMTGDGGGSVSPEGYRCAEFTKGVVELESSGTDLVVKRMYFTGPQIKTRMIRGGFNPFYNVIRADLLTSFSGVNCPVRLVGALDNPEVDKMYFLTEFFKKNTSAAGENTLNVLSLGLTGKDDDEVWSVPAEPLPPVSQKGIRPGGQAPGSR